jgi:hypothetical protein
MQHSQQLTCASSCEAQREIAHKCMSMHAAHARRLRRWGLVLSALHKVCECTAPTSPHRWVSGRSGISSATSLTLVRVIASSDGQGFWGEAQNRTRGPTFSKAVQGALQRSVVGTHSLTHIPSPVNMLLLLLLTRAAFSHLCAPHHTTHATPSFLRREQATQQPSSQEVDGWWTRLAHCTAVAAGGARWNPLIRVE